MSNYIPVSLSHRDGDGNLEKIECILQLIMGLQNDILGKITSPLFGMFGHLF